MEWPQVQWGRPRGNDDLSGGWPGLQDDSQPLPGGRGSAIGSPGQTNTRLPLFSFQGPESFYIFYINSSGNILYYIKYLLIIPKIC